MTNRQGRGGRVLSRLSGPHEGVGTSCGPDSAGSGHPRVLPANAASIRLTRKHRNAFEGTCCAVTAQSARRPGKEGIQPWAIVYLEDLWCHEDHALALVAV